MLTYLTQLPIAKFIWTPDEAQKAFNRMKAPQLLIRMYLYTILTKMKNGT